MKKKSKYDEYLFYLQKILDLLENIADEDLRKNILKNILKCNKAISEFNEIELKKLNEMIFK